MNNIKVLLIEASAEMEMGIPPNVAILVAAVKTAGFDVEILFLASKLGFKIKEVDVTWNYVDTRRVNPIKDSLSGFLDLMKIRFNSIMVIYCTTVCS